MTAMKSAMKSMAKAVASPGDPNFKPQLFCKCCARPTWSLFGRSWLRGQHCCLACMNTRGMVHDETCVSCLWSPPLSTVVDPANAGQGRSVDKMKELTNDTMVMYRGMRFHGADGVIRRVVGFETDPDTCMKSPKVVVEKNRVLWGKKKKLVAGNAGKAMKKKGAAAGKAMRAAKSKKVMKAMKAKKK